MKLCIETYQKSIEKNLVQKNEDEIIKFLDWNYSESASNFANSTRIELIDQDQYYQTYEEVFESAVGNKNSI
jgi:hypothetical protein